MDEVEKLRLNIMALTHRKGFVNSLLERGWSLFHCAVANSKTQQAGATILVAPQVSACTMECTPVNERVAAFCYWVGGWILTVVPMAQTAVQYIHIFGVLRGRRAPYGGSLVFVNSPLTLATVRTGGA